LRSQFLFKLSEPILTGDWVRTLNRQAALMAGSDTMVINPSTLLRLPGSIAWPKKDGRVPELTEWVTPARHQDTYALDGLRFGFPPVTDEGPALTSTEAATNTTGLLNPIRDLIDQVRAGPHWHEPTLRLVAMLVGRGRQDCEILAMAEHLTWPAYSVAQTRNDLAKMIEGARRKGFAPDVDDAGPESPTPDIDDIMGVPSSKAAATFPVLTKEKIFALLNPEWLIAGLMATDAFAVLYGQFRSYKSFIALDWALCLATGTPWCGRTVKQCDILYIAGEGVAGLKLRIAAWLQHHGIDGPFPGFRVIPLAVNLMDKTEAERLILTVTEEHKADGFDPKLVIVDTLHRSMPGGDENSAKDMGVVVRNTALIQRQIACALLAVHHAGKDAERGLRGSSGLPGATDAIVRITRTDDRATLVVEKQKDAEDGQEIRLRAQIVSLPLVNGTVQPHSSLILTADEEPPLAKKTNLTPTERHARQYLADLIVAEGAPLPQGSNWPSPVNGQPLQGVTTIRWQEECEARQLSTAEARSNRNMIFRRASQSLLDKNVIAVRDNLVWLT
jgi:hypothetical protein